MLAPSPVVKKTAKIALSQCFLPSVAVCCVTLFIFFSGILLSSLVSVFAGTGGYIFTLFIFLVLGFLPLLLGVLLFFRRLLWEQQDSVVIIFKYFSNLQEYTRALHFIFLLTLRLVFAGVVLFSPCFVIQLLSSEAFYEMLSFTQPIWTSNLWTLNSFICIVAFFALMFVMLKYYLAPFIFVSNDDVDPAEAVNMSTIISKRTGGDFFGLVLSFSGWLLLSVFVAPLVFTLPYFLASYGVHCRFAITAYNRDVDNFNASVTPSYSTDEL